MECIIGGVLGVGAKLESSEGSSECTSGSSSNGGSEEVVIVVLKIVVGESILVEYCGKEWKES